MDILRHINFFLIELAIEIFLKFLKIYEFIVMFRKKLTLCELGCSIYIFLTIIAISKYI